MHYLKGYLARAQNALNGNLPFGTKSEVNNYIIGDY